MVILPAIDLKDGKCVRLYKGDFATVHQVSESPVETARHFYDCGARYIHMVDLDGAKDGLRKNTDIVRQVTASTQAKIELGGGIRSMADIDALAELGVYRFVIGSAAVEDRAFVRAAVEKYGERVAVGVDAKDGFVRTRGWIDNSGLEAVRFAEELEDIGVSVLIFTDIDTDGTLQGPPVARLKTLREAVSCRIIASGGVGCLDDIKCLRDLGMDGAIIGKAYYSGNIDLEQAVREGGDQCWQNA